MATNSPNMGLQIPAVRDADYPGSVSNSLTILDGHDHSAGKGVQITGSGIADGAISTPKVADGAITAEKIAAAAIAALMPSGSILAFGGGAEPTGWMICDGRAVSRATYAALYAAIGTSWGYGDGTTTFNIPDLRGRFLRGRDAGTGRDSNAGTREASAAGGATGDNVGSVQGDATKMPNAPFGTATAGAHSHTYYRPQDVTMQTGSGNVVGDDIDYADSTSTAGDHTHTITGGDLETRPKNAAVNYIIKV